MATKDMYTKTSQKKQFKKKQDKTIRERKTFVAPDDKDLFQIKQSSH